MKNLFGQEPYALRGENDARLAAAEAELALINSGAWTPFSATPTPTGGSFTAASGSGAYSRVGRTINFRYNATITTVGTGTGDVLFNLPVAYATDTWIFGTGREGAISGHILTAWTHPGLAPFTVQISGSAPANGKFYSVAGSYEAAS